MQNERPFEIVEVGLDSPLLEEVIKLHNASKARLGPFPRGAFEDHARQKVILAAVTSENYVAGYLLYRKSITKNRATIVHLTRSDRFKSKGIARLLVDALKEKTRHLFGINLSCRRDYDIAGMWQNFGFTVRHTKRGRGRNGASLDCWWFDHKHEDLFSQAAQDISPDQIQVVIDANVFYDLICDDRPHADDTRVLEADWLQDSIILCVTREIYNEIHRSPNEADKTRCRAAAQQFCELKTNDAEVHILELELKPHFNAAIIERDISDMRQVAHAINAGVAFFVTRDGPVLKHSDMIFEKYGLRILHPTDLINRLDVLRREAEYRPARLVGSDWRERLVVSEDIGVIVEAFKHKSNERAGNFEKQVRHHLANPAEWVSKVVANGGKLPTVYIVYSPKKQPHLDVAIFSHTDHPLAGTLLRHLMHEMSREATDNNHKVISVADSEISDETIAALTELGFVYDSNKWWKMSVPGICTREGLISEIRNAAIPLSLKERFVGAYFMDDADANSTAARLEHLFSPVKLVSSSMPCYIVSIRPSWAAHFFDISKGGQARFDLNEKLHLGIEGAYYCSAHNKHVSGPARILWYVSGKGSMSIRACSHLEEVHSGSAKVLFARFQHLGIYTWRDVLKNAGGIASHPLIAFRFLRTERFDRPVTLAELQKMKVPLPQNPRLITSEQFETIYKLGMNLV